MIPADQLWLAITRSNPSETSNPLMIAIAFAVYGHMLQKVRSLVKDRSENCTSNCTLPSEPDEVYLCFGGGALADMFKQCYKDMKSKKSSKNSKKVFQQLQVLQWIQRDNKSTLPASLAYRDKGGMYFPEDVFLPFFKSVDECVRERKDFSVMAKALSRLLLNECNIINSDLEQ